MNALESQQCQSSIHALGEHAWEQSKAERKRSILVSFAPECKPEKHPVFWQDLWNASFKSIVTNPLPIEFVALLVSRLTSWTCMSEKYGSVPVDLKLCLFLGGLHVLWHLLPEHSSCLKHSLSPSWHTFITITPWKWDGQLNPVTFVTVFRTH